MRGFLIMPVMINMINSLGLKGWLHFYKIKGCISEEIRGSYLRVWSPKSWCICWVGNKNSEFVHVVVVEKSYGLRGKNKGKRRTLKAKLIWKQGELQLFKEECVLITINKCHLLSILHVWSNLTFIVVKEKKKSTLFFILQKIKSRHTDMPWFYFA